LILGSIRDLLTKEKSSMVKNVFAGITELYKKNHEIIRGIDLYGEEDLQHTNDNYVDDIINFLRNTVANDLDFVVDIHSGETNETQFPVNKNVKALLDINDDQMRGRKLRIGHGIAIWKYPKLIEQIKTRNMNTKVMIEICPISNQNLGFYPDIRNNPGFSYYMSGIPISISPDDGASFGSDGVTSDWKRIIPDWNLSLFDVYKICKYSLEFSSVKENARKAMISQFNVNFKQFLKEVEQLPDTAATGGRHTRRRRSKRSKGKKRTARRRHRKSRSKRSVKRGRS
jgi:adenosine deaminase